MKKLLFVINNLETGGVQISLRNLLKEISGKYDITVLSFHGKPEYQEFIPEGIKLIYAKSPFKYLGMSHTESKARFFDFVLRSFWALLTKIIGRSRAIKLMLPFQKKLCGYDVAISYLHEAQQRILYGGCNEFVLKKVSAKKKITWLHCDFGLCGANNEESRKIYKQFDAIVACSEGTKSSFVACVPSFENKCIAIRNCNDYESIKLLSVPAKKYDMNCFNIITVARLAQEKGIARGIKAVKTCITEGIAVHYHIVGSGDQENSLKVLVNELGISENVTFYGNQKNPYQYIAPADLFILPSYHEAAPMVFDEAACLGVPILATKTTSTDEMILNSAYGYVCDNNDAAVLEKLEWIIAHKDSLAAIKDNLKTEVFNNKDSVNKFKKMME